MDCSKCGVRLVRIVSKQRATYGQAFIKCPNNIKVSQLVFSLDYLGCSSLGLLIRLGFCGLQGDPTTCGTIMSEAQYEAWLRKPEQQQQIRSKMYLCSGEGGHGSVDLIVENKEELNEMKQKLDSAVADLWVLKLQV